MSRTRTIGVWLAVCGLLAIGPGTSLAAGIASTTTQPRAGLNTGGLAAQQTGANVSINYDGTAVTLHPTAEQVVTGTTTLAPGTNVSIRLQSSDGEQAFLMTETTTVADDGRVTARFDLSDMTPPVTATLYIRANDGAISREVPVEIVAKQTPSTTTSFPTTTVVTTHTDTATPTSVPGFGIAASVVALLLGALGLRRRQ